MILLYIFSLQFFTVKAQHWSPKANIPKGRYSTTIFAIGNKVYVGGGQSLCDFWEFDTQKNTWTDKGTLPGCQNGNRVAGITFTIDGKGYVGLGADYTSGNYYTDLWQYDPTTNNWSQKKGFPATGREGSVCFTIGKSAYIIGGAATSRFAEVWEYNTNTDNWTLKTPFPGGVVIYGMGFSINGIGYMVGGNAGASATITDKMYAYDAIKNAWTQKASIPNGPRQSGIAFVLNSIGYCGLGDDGASFDTYNDLYSYDPQKDLWTKAPDFPGGGRSGAIGIATENKAYAGMGTFNALADWWEYGAFPAYVKEINSDEVTCYPNPVTAVLNVKAQHKSHLIIYNTEGKIIFDNTLVNQNTLSTENWAPGLYRYSIIEENGRITKGEIVKR